MNITNMTFKEKCDKVIAALLKGKPVTYYNDDPLHLLHCEALTIMQGLAEDAEPVAYMHEGTLGRYFNENRSEVNSIPLYCAPMTHDSEFIQIPVAYQYAYPDGMWRCSYGDEINGSKPISSRALYAKKDGK